eukprot:242896-Alexandrium_andersonii.AAC.1
MVRGPACGLSAGEVGRVHGGIGWAVKLVVQAWVECMAGCTVKLVRWAVKLVVQPRHVGPCEGCTACPGLECWGRTSVRVLVERASGGNEQN